MSSQSILHNLDSSSSIKLPFILLMIVIALCLGTTTGYLLSSKSISPSTNGNTVTKDNKTAGIVDPKTFKDEAEGILKEGGIEGEGSFHLERPGGISQNVYLTSTTVDLSKYVDKKVHVWGATFKGQHAAWLMDVGLVKDLQ